MITSTFKRTEGGNVEIIFTIPATVITTTQDSVVKEMSKDITVPGFRKGNAPLQKVLEKINPEKLREHILNHILPESFSDSVKEHKFKPAIYPKFEIVKIGQGSDWEIKALTCELPEVVLPNDYKKKLKNDPKDQNTLIKSLLEVVKVQIPKMLIEEEVNARLSQVLERIEKLGLALEGYLKSVGKTPDQLRKEYEEQAIGAISIEIILNKIANEEKIDVTKKEIDDFIKTTGSELEKVEKEQRDVLKRVIFRKKALEKLSK